MANDHESSSSKQKGSSERENALSHLRQVLDLHDSRVRQLFHLERYVSLVYYDPEEARKDNSADFEKFSQKRDLWENIITKAPSRAARRHIQNTKEAFEDWISESTPKTQPVVVKTPPKPKKRPRDVEVPKLEPLELKDVSSYLNDVSVQPSKRQKLRGIKPVIRATHPWHVTSPRFGGSLSKLLDSYKALEEDLDSDQWKEYVLREARTYKRVSDAKANGELTRLLELEAGAQIPKFIDPSHGKSHHDNLVSQAVYLAKLRQNLRRARQSADKRMAQAVEHYFRNLAGADERARKEHERQIRQIARRTAQEVMKKWRLAEKVVEQRRQSYLAQQHREKGKEYLNQILEHSAQLIESRFDDIGPELAQSEIDEELEASNDESDDDNNSENESSSSPRETGFELEKPSEELLRIYEQAKGQSSEEDSLSESDSESISSSGDSSDSESEENEAPRRKSRLSEMLGYTSEADSSNSESEAQETENSGAVVEAVKSDDQADKSSDSDLPVKNHEEGQDRDNSAELHQPTKSEVVSASADDQEKGQHFPRVEIPFLLRGTLREYQRNGLDWLLGLYKSQTNGILADEMGLGKTIQTIALLAHLACEKGIWGPHLIVVPTSVMLNWEMEFKRFCPGFKVLTYYGNPQQRKRKRRGWSKEDTWNVVITSYQLVIQDQVAFRSKKWRYMILDEAHNIKNFRSQRWQALLNFNSERRLLLTGTPLQNNLVELWSLLYFLMPSSRGTQMMPQGFASLDDFQDWFAKPVDQMVEEGEEAGSEARQTIMKLHHVLRPYLLRRLKADVEQQMPGKFEHIVFCRLSKRQRYLYDDFMSRASTKKTLASGNFMSILNCLMQLRKVCNHPDLFEVRPIVTSFELNTSVPSRYEGLAHKFDNLFEPADVNDLNLIFPDMEVGPKWAALESHDLSATHFLRQELAEWALTTVPCDPSTSNLDQSRSYLEYQRKWQRAARRQRLLFLNRMRTSRLPIYGSDLRKLVTVPSKLRQPGELEWDKFDPMNLLKNVRQRESQMKEIIVRYSFITPATVCLDQPELTLGTAVSTCPELQSFAQDPTFHESQVRLSIAFPDKRLLQYDCGKLQKLDPLLRDLISNGHRALIFTQMTRVLDILEQFLNIHGWRYLRLDGATRIEQRQALTERFNKDPTIPIFILSTRSGGLGINLTGADSVIFYDSDWNPAMDRQCQDRCHRIGQTRDVHIYRLVSEYTIESNILRKATQKTILDNVVIQEGDFTTEYFNRTSVSELLGNNAGRDVPSLDRPKNLEKVLAQAEDADDAAAANVALSEARMDAEEFGRQGSKDETPHEDTGASTTEKTFNETPNEEQSHDKDTHMEDAPVAPTDEEEEEEEEEKKDDDEKEIGSIDDFMVRAIERGDLVV